MADLKNKVILTVAPTGAWPSKQDNPAVPLQPAEIAEDVYTFWKAGASVAHIHVRDDNNKSSMDYNKFVETVKLIRATYKERRDVMLEMMEEMFPQEVRWTHPLGGMFLWGILPEEMDAAEVLKVAIQRKVAFVPGESFHPNGGGKNTMRLNFSYSNPETIRQGITRLGTLLKELVVAGN